MSELAAIQMLQAIAAVLVVLPHAIMRQAEWHQTDQLTPRWQRSRTPQASGSSPSSTNSAWPAPPAH
jgi:hypothetical protein